MTDMLDQNEIDSLLAAVEGGDVETEVDTGPSLVYSLRRGGITDAELEIRDYDFKRPERVSKDQMRALETLHDVFSRGFGASLSGFLRTIVEVKVADIEQMTFSEFTHSLPNPTCFNLLSCKPLDGSICLDLSPLIIYPIIDRLLGGSNAELFIPQRPLTAIELRLVNKIISRGMDALREAWQNIVEIKFNLEESESNPALVQIVPPNEVVVVVGFEMKMGGRAGTMSLCIPYNVIEPVVERLSNQTWEAYKKSVRNTQIRQRVAEHLEVARVPIRALLAETRLSIGDLKHLQAGDIITTEKPASAPLAMEIGGQRKFIGQLGQYRGNRAFKVTRKIQPKDRV
ncbi:flagellar motor switch protein FliM [Mucisphaera calidilacus]|uniref:Flagellar motor switch protein FliM n=1 Tax=Mucisphaera calidilacus TaxID=2527982 RepID=A0A518BXC1_9BACT|nr:flagellar motor switch protein FliM [Mucisphaera calidilacus]QDU71631.1 Flagellar motor switch protein FliM [Mucisphaera calidilacus]